VVGGQVAKRTVMMSCASWVLAVTVPTTVMISQTVHALTAGIQTLNARISHAEILVLAVLVLLVTCLLQTFVSKTKVTGWEANVFHMEVLSVKAAKWVHVVGKMVHTTVGRRTSILFVAVKHIALLTFAIG